MNAVLANQSKRLQLVVAFTAAVLFSSCATQPTGTPQEIAAARFLKDGRSIHLSLETRAADYLEAAALSAPHLGPGTQPTLARRTYNAASAELTVLLRNGDGGRLWNHPLTLTANSTTYHLRIQPGGYAVWSPTYFNSFLLSEPIKEKLIKKQNHLNGVGGTLVGVRQTNPREPFVPKAGTSAAVTSTLDFKGNDATLALRRPTKQTTAVIEGKTRPLAADFSAPISYHQPPANLLLVGFLRGIRGSESEKTGLFFLQPYDPDRIPIVFVHGLFSTTYNWDETINGLQADAEVRRHYQFWVFSYTTGNPILYSALRLREELAKVDKLYPNHKPIVMVGHSMGGMLTREQVTTVTEAMWEKDPKIGATAKSIFAKNSNDSQVVRAMTYHANPRIKRVVFVCTPHRGSDIATNNIGKIGISLIRLPFNVAKTMTDALTGQEIAQLTGSSKRLPTSISGLKPSNPSFPILNSAPITVPYHSIIGDKGKGNTPNSSDGVVAYWSSHLDGAKSEKIVPGPHGSCNLPQTITELDRILELHLKTL